MLSLPRLYRKKDRNMHSTFVSTRGILLTTAFAGLPLAALSQDLGEVIELDTVVLSAAGVGVDPLLAPASVSVVTGDDLEKAGIDDLTDALREVPGVAVTGGADAENILMRGLPAEYTLIMVDGKRLNSRASRTNGAGGTDQYYIPPWRRSSGSRWCVARCRRSMGRTRWAG